MIENNSVEIRSEILHGFQRIMFSGELVYGQTEKIREEIFSLLVDCDGYILDLQNVKTIDSTGFGILVSIAKKLKNQNRNRMVVVINKPSILQLFKITKLTLIFPVVETKEEAVKLLSEGLSSPPELLIDDY
ncbi:anti-anti-sigma factor [Schinkia azotoformans MEV2011]|uniref:Anti-sigma factor antagonist n=1 Tax=Schinkia azotoformans MEV2011 TaxID=1348973 RepID=A0A072NS02_SCHAZ|nr:STAS domain-containing protein [Schinkia azotoformans]KEF40007.1 anti-anti-sigma factor [Schinkia azotoformans MEV2011]MEC1694703.1 STAS domain-containing protein [Schinkia azotoformans]MEC1716935.1 STAS domain-containing protein [Schinkia azotoformans]MEC1726386.1 STAS domain-containing protein [Schinkia azotoformans]MEC1743217.1 STAS domain-containing protein [Schinkia azotoformans]